MEELQQSTQDKILGNHKQIPAEEEEAVAVAVSVRVIVKESITVAVTESVMVVVRESVSTDVISLVTVAVREMVDVTTFVTVAVIVTGPVTVTVTVVGTQFVAEDEVAVDEVEVVVAKQLQALLILDVEAEHLERKAGIPVVATMI